MEKVTFELNTIVRSKGKVIAVPDKGRFTTDKPLTIFKLEQLGFKKISEGKEEVKPATTPTKAEPKPPMKKSEKKKGKGK